MLDSGDVVLAAIQFVDSFELKKRPAVVLFKEFGNVIVAGMTSNTKMKGVRLSPKDGAAKESVIKTNYIFTIPEKAIQKRLFRLNREKRQELYDNLLARLSMLNA